MKANHKILFTISLKKGYPVQLYKYYLQFISI